MSANLGKILVVDDNEDLLLAIRLFMRDHAQIVDLETDPSQIPDRLAKIEYQLVLLDMNFTQDTTSGKEGLHWLQEILRIRPLTKVVMITGFGDVEMAVDSVKLGAADFVLKPFKNEKLLEACRRALQPGRTMAPGEMEKHRLARELATAHEVQDRLFPQVLPQVPGLNYTAICRPAMETGGDYYDFLNIARRSIGIAVGDVSGKGVSAALLMANLQGRLQSFAPIRQRRLDRLIADINESMCRATESAHYATFFYGLYEDQRRTLTYVNAGHHAPMLFRSNGPANPIRLSTGGMVIGLFPDNTYQQATIDLNPGDVLVLFTDGLVEASNSQDEFGEHRIASIVRRFAHLEASQIQDEVLAHMARFTGGAKPRDDMTLIVAKVLAT